MGKSIIFIQLLYNLLTNNHVFLYDMKNAIFIITLIILLILVQVMPAFSQTKKIKEQSMITGKDITITVQGEQKNSLKTPERYNPTLLFTRNGDGLLLGNPCAEEVMRYYLFHYEIVPQQQGISGSRYFFHNTWANIKLFFKNSPGWKKRMRKKIATCRIKTGDFVGFELDFNTFEKENKEMN